MTHTCTARDKCVRCDQATSKVVHHDKKPKTQKMSREEKGSFADQLLAMGSENNQDTFIHRMASTCKHNVVGCSAVSRKLGKNWSEVASPAFRQCILRWMHGWHLDA